MNKYVVNENYASSRREVAAESFATVGDFIDFYATDKYGHDVVVLRIKASEVVTIELTSGLD